MSYRVSKGVFDRTAALTLGLALLPVLVAIALAVKASSPGPALFVQKRTGRRSRIFRIYKFRTMHHGTETQRFAELNEMLGPLYKTRRDPRITPVGRFLRRWSLDELPQLYNVLRGEMSLVGPRPLPLEESKAVRDRDMARFEALPGITGLWQATCRDSLDGQRKIELDAEYARSRSWKLDLIILAKTLPTVWRGIGAW